MSVKLLSLVFDLDGITATEKIVLLFLADSTNAETQRCDPGWQRIADKCGLSKTGTRKITQRLIDKGYLSKTEREGKSNAYIVLPKGCNPVAPSDLGVQPRVTDGVQPTVAGGVQPRVAPNQKEPEDNRAESSTNSEGEHWHMIQDGRCRRNGCEHKEA